MDNGGTVFLIEDVTDRTIAEAKINHMARYDALTGLPNRVILRNRIEKTLAENGQNDMFAVHFVDLDQFKQVNDTLGHTSGDMLLKAVAERLRPLIRDTDIIARFGGDEFVIMQSPIRSASEASGLARRVSGRAAGHLRDQRPRSGHQRLDRHRACAQGWRRRRSVDAQRRHGAVSGQVRQSRHMALLQAGDGSLARRRAAISNSTCATRSRTTPSRFTISRSSICAPSVSSPAKRCCAGRIPSAA